MFALKTVQGFLLYSDFPPLSCNQRKFVLVINNVNITIDDSINQPRSSWQLASPDKVPVTSRMVGGGKRQLYYPGKRFFPALIVVTCFFRQHQADTHTHAHARAHTDTRTRTHRKEIQVLNLCLFCWLIIHLQKVESLLELGRNA